jgi:asparagine synthase (glutamine-hydrolysing)
MCGICGIAGSPGQTIDESVLCAMTNAIAHRGPDGEGLFVDGHVGLGHRRLSLIDLEGGSQPIFNEDRSVVVIYNGEIFNYRELTDELLARGHVFQTRSDTETLVHLYEEHGMDMLQKLRGMFAFALLDRRSGAVYLVRDRFGIKPLYYHQRQGRLWFASEVKPLIVGGYSVEVNAAGVHAFMKTRFAHGDETIFKGVFRLPEGTYLEWRGGEARLHTFYPDPPHVSHAMDTAEADQRFEASFSDAVRAWMVADVPVGAYLSGGIDSSMIVSEMTRLTSHPVRTFCVDFKEGHSEADAAAATAKQLGCEHETVVCGIDELLELPAVIRSLEEPVGDGIVVANYVLARATRAARVKTVLTGDGADETLGGYQYLRAIARMRTWADRLPVSLLSTLGVAVARRLPAAAIKAMADLPLDVGEHARDRLIAVLKTLPSRDMRQMYDLLLALYRPDELPGVYTDAYQAQQASTPDDPFAGEPNGRTIVDQVLSMQYRKWLPANINFKQDKLCMAYSVENRVELMTRMPERLKIAGRESKVLLRRLARKRFPPAVSAARKVPFHLPLQHYMHDARLWAFIDDNLDEARVRRRGIVRPEYVRRLKDESRRGDYLLSKKLMALVILEVWHRIFVDREAV